MPWNIGDDESAALDYADAHEPASWLLPECDSFGLPILGRLLGYWPVESSEWTEPAISRESGS